MLEQDATPEEDTKLTDEDWDAVRLLRNADYLRKTLKEVERDLNRAVIAFGKRRGYITGCYREFHMRSELQAKGVID